MGMGMWNGFPPQPTRGLGERRKLPQRGPGQSPGRKRIFGTLLGRRRLLMDRKMWIFSRNAKQKFVFSDTKTMRLRHTVNHEILFSRIGYIWIIRHLQIWAKLQISQHCMYIVIVLCYVFCLHIFIGNFQRIFWTSNSEIRMHLCSIKFAEIRLTVIWYCVA